MDSYAAEAERFISAIDREYFMHFAGHKDEYEIEPIYERHAGLFERDAVERLRDALGQSEAGDVRRRRRYLLQLAVEGFIGEQTKAATTELAERESTLTIKWSEARSHTGRPRSSSPTSPIPSGASSWRRRATKCSKAS